MTRAVGNHSSASADYSLLRKMRFLSCRNSIMKKKKKKKKNAVHLASSASALCTLGVFTEHCLKHCALWRVCICLFFFPPFKKNKIKYNNNNSQKTQQSHPAGS